MECNVSAYPHAYFQTRVKKHANVAIFFCSLCIVVIDDTDVGGVQSPVQTDSFFLMPEKQVSWVCQLIAAFEDHTLSREPPEAGGGGGPPWATGRPADHFCGERVPTPPRFAVPRALSYHINDVSATCNVWHNAQRTHHMYTLHTKLQHNTAHSNITPHHTIPHIEITFHNAVHCSHTLFFVLTRAFRCVLQMLPKSMSVWVDE